MGLFIEQAFVARLGDERSDLVGIECRCDFVDRFDPEHSEHHVRNPVQEPNQRLKNGHNDVEGRAKSNRGALRTRDRNVLGHHFTEHHVKCHHDDQCDTKSDAMKPGPGHSNGGERLLELMRDGGFANRA